MNVHLHRGARKCQGKFRFRHDRTAPLARGAEPPAVSVRRGESMRHVLIAAALFAAGPALADTATVMAYSDGPFQDNYTQTVLDPYNRQGGPNKIEFHGSASSATMLGELRTQKTSPQVDVVIMDTTTAAIACAEGLIEKITPDMLPMMGDLDKQALDANGCGPAVTFDHFIIGYDAKAVQPAPTSLMQ